MTYIKQSIMTDDDCWLNVIKNIESTINLARDLGDSERRTPNNVMSLLIDAKLHRMWISRKFGGLELSLATGMAIIEAIAKIDASVSWQIGVQGAIGRLSDYLPESTAKYLFEEHNGLIVGVVMATGRAEIVDGGYKLSGQWAFASGSSYADWLVCCAVVTKNGIACKTESGEVVTRMLFIPKSAYTIIDDWFTTGLKATSSNSFKIEDAFVKDDFTIDSNQLSKPPAYRESRVFGISYNDFGPFTSMPTALGIAADALTSFDDLAEKKIRFGGKDTLNKSHVVHEKIGMAYALLLSSHLLVENLLKQIAITPHDNDSLTALIRLTSPTVADNATTIVNTVHALAGTSSSYTSNRIEKCFRDIHTANKHITLALVNREMVGQYLMKEGLYLRR